MMKVADKPKIKSLLVPHTGAITSTPANSSRKSKFLDPIQFMAEHFPADSQHVPSTPSLVVEQISILDDFSDLKMTSVFEVQNVESDHENLLTSGALQIDASVEEIPSFSKEALQLTANEIFSEPVKPKPKKRRNVSFKKIDSYMSSSERDLGILSLRSEDELAEPAKPPIVLIGGGKWKRSVIMQRRSRNFQLFLDWNNC